MPAELAGLGKNIPVIFLSQLGLKQKEEEKHERE